VIDINAPKTGCVLAVIVMLMVHVWRATLTMLTPPARE
jgi:hypothetical protein